MTKLFSTNQRKKLAVTTAISLIALGAIVGIAASISFGGALGASSVASASGAVYITDNNASGNNVWVYPRASNGQLGSAKAYSTGGLGTGSALATQGALVLTQDNHWLLVVDAGSNQITVFKIQGTTLSRASVTGSQGPDPISLTVSGNFVYVLDGGNSTQAPNIAGFTLGSTGALKAIAGSVEGLSGLSGPSPEQIGFNPQGNVLVVTEKGTNIIDTYTVNSNGVESKPSSQASAGSGPYGFAFTHQGQLIVSEAASDSVSSYTVAKSGQLTIVSGSIPTFGNAPCWLEIDANSNFAFTTNAHGGTISIFSIAKSSQLTLFSSISAHTAIPALDMAFSQNNQFLYVHDGSTITGYQVLSDGSISSITTVNGVASSASGLAAN
jgi:6-phosphogluconolactonase